ncbi:hypothetical protein AUJ73_01465 [Candidatus Gottesmanbacteria bacterium CG1_02_37_22]|uniref:Uncharacterized protein n=2 Tax=Candidatus Gottesmaniibacteriota TaxID=1752720 RepID=A0A1J4TWY6_9BACT|nr:MAG: hypothetical protein AUJ73_01465 [Candidatus Gottesmanbacteria bacterium CG1_02_37_22]
MKPGKIRFSINYLSVTYFAYVVIVIINIISLIYTNSPSNKSQLLTKKVNHSNPAILGQTSFSQLGILLPLYIYPAGNPNPDWQKIADTQKIQNIPVVAIVNPHSGPGVCSTSNPDSNYKNNMQVLRNAGVTMVGYVATGYGSKLSNNVKNEIDQYANCFDVKGIFFDEVNGNASFLNYYKELYNYVKSKSNFDLVVINPGQNIDEVFLKENTFDIAVIYEDYANNWSSYNPPSFISNYPNNHFAALIHSTANDVQTMKTYIDSALNRNIGYVYITNDSLPNPWDSLPPYWQNEIEYIKIINNGITTTPTPTPVPTVTVTPGPQTTTLSFKVGIPRMGTSEVPQDRVKVDIVSSQGEGINTSVALVREGDGIYRTKGSGLSFNLGSSGTYRVYVKLTTSIGRVYNNVSLVSGSVLDCTIENTSCGDMKPSSSLLSVRALLLGDTDNYSYNWINIADFDKLVEEFLGRVSTKYTDFNLDGSVDVLDLEVLGLNFNKRGD